MEIARDILGPADFFERCGEESARYAINSFYRFLLRFKTPHWILERSTGMWGAGRLTGAKNAQVTHPWCRNRGSAGCVFVGRWS